MTVRQWVGRKYRVLRCRLFHDGAWPMSFTKTHSGGGRWEEREHVGCYNCQIVHQTIVRVVHESPRTRLDEALQAAAEAPIAEDAGPLLMGTWARADIRRAFVEGVAWWEVTKTGGTIWSSDRRLAEDEAERRYPRGLSK